MDAAITEQPVTHIDPANLPSNERLDLLGQIVARVVRRRRVPSRDAEDFSRWAHLCLLERWYDVFGRFAGPSSPARYLTRSVAARADLAAKHPARSRPVAVPDRVLADVAAPAFVLVEASEHRRREGRMRRALGDGLRRLSHEERQPLHARFDCGESLRTTAARMNVDAKLLHRRYDRALARLRTVVTGATEVGGAIISTAHSTRSALPGKLGDAWR